MRFLQRLADRIELKVMTWRVRFQERYPGPAYTPVDRQRMTELRTRVKNG